VLLRSAADVGRKRPSHRVDDHDPVRDLPGQPGHPIDDTADESTPPSAQCTSNSIGQPGVRL
jgi:hypothetical protein